MIRQEKKECRKIHIGQECNERRKGTTATQALDLDKNYDYVKITPVKRSSGSLGTEAAQRTIKHK